MDRLAAALRMDPVEVRRRNAMEQGSAGPTGQVIDSPAPVAEMLRRVQQMPLPPGVDAPDLRLLPGGGGKTTHGEGIRRGVGYPAGDKNVGFPEGFDHHSTAKVPPRGLPGGP